jgi:HD-like signal output (HDOD) protein
MPATELAPPPPARTLPPELAAFQITPAQDLPQAQRDALTEALRHIPRPPRSLHQLISPEFLATATSVEMSELVMSEPLIAAKVLSTVNSPLYGLQRSVTSIGQAITFLGMNTVRSICLRYMLDESFKAGDPASQRVFERLWTASAVASELCSRLTKQLHMPDAGTLVTKVVLSFVGHMAVATLPQSRSQPALTDLSLDLVQRYSAQQQALGLCAPEIGRLLMAAWELPASIVQGVGDIDLTLTHAVGELETAAATRRAVAYLSARLAERLAGGGLGVLSSWDLAADTAICTHHVAGYLQPQQQAALQGVLKAPDTQAAVAQLLGKGAQPG